MRWWILAFLAAVVLLGSAGGFLWKQRPKPPPTPTAAVPRERCRDADASVPPLVIPPETTPLLLGAAGKVRLFLDDRPTSSPPEHPTRFPPGEHVLRAESEGTSIRLTFRLAPFRPAMFHFEETAALGLTGVFLGAECVSCPTGVPPALDFTRTSATDDALLDEAAKALRTSDWRAASARLRAVQPKSRQGDGFRRLAANVYQSTGQASLARAELAKVSSADLQSALLAWDPLAAQELAREGSPEVQRWNLLTQKFAKLLDAFAPDAPGPVQLATSRLSELTTGFLVATQRKDSSAQEETVDAAEEALDQFVRALRRGRPEDCAFQARISASL